MIELVLDAQRPSRLLRRHRVVGGGGPGKPSPDVYVEAARRLDAAPEQCVAVDDSTNGIRAALAAGMSVVAVPNAHFPPDHATLADAGIVVGTLDELAPELVMTLPVP